MGRAKEQDRVTVLGAKGCPFCGGARVSTQKIADLYYCGCDSCHAGAKWDKDRDTAIANWNHRVKVD